MATLKLLKAEHTVEKATEGDKSRILSNGVENAYTLDGDCCHWAWMSDYDDEYVYFRTRINDQYVTFKDGYTFNGTSVTFEGSPTEVVQMTEYTDVVKSVEETAENTLIKKLTKILDKLIGDSKETDNKNALIIKQFDDEEMVAIEPLYAAPDSADGDDEGMSLETIKGMVASANVAIEKGALQSKYFHKEVTEDFHFVKAWVNECDCYIGEHFVPEGQPIMKVQFTNELAWEARKSGDLMGLSIGARAKNTIEVE